MSWVFGHLKAMGYGAILIDCPWRYKMRSAKGYEKAPEAQYPTMSDEDILALPVADLAQRDCIIFMWATWPRLDFAHECRKKWGANHITGGVWLKRSAGGGLRMGPGYVLRTVCEPFIIARFGESQERLTDQINAIAGDPKQLRIMPDEIGGIAIDGLAREHSRKPPQARQLLERLTPRAFRCELFGREPWPGNDVWGNEANKFARVT